MNGMSVACEVKREQAEHAVWLLSRAGGTLRPPMAIISRQDLHQADVAVYLRRKLRSRGWAQAAAAHTPRGEPRRERTRLSSAGSGPGAITPW